MTESTDPPRLDTTGRIAERLGVPTYRVSYIVATRNIAPAAYAGNVRLFDREAVALIRHAIHTIDARREGGGHE